jgi:30S ribosomal protein S31
MRLPFRVIIAPLLQRSASIATTILGGSMGRGDKRTRKGKIFKGSYGKSRPHRAKKQASTPAAAKAAGRKGA